MVVQDLNSAKLTSKLNTAGDIEAILKDYVPNFPIYGAVTLNSDSPSYAFRKSSNVNFEGVYYTLFIYAREKLDSNDSILPPGSVFSDSRSPISEYDRHLQISGRILYRNSKGFLSADRQPLLKFYWITLVILLAIAFFWFFVCIKHRSNLIFIHKFLATIVIT